MTAGELKRARIIAEQAKRQAAQQLAAPPPPPKKKPRTSWASPHRGSRFPSKPGDRTGG